MKREAKTITTALWVLLGACAPGAELAADGAVGAGDAPALADRVIEAPGASGEGFSDPGRAIDGVRGGGDEAQSLSVYSIPAGSFLVLGWTDRRVLDGPGPELAVFENAFHYTDELTFMDPTVVEVSDDGERWVTLPHDYVADDETRYSARTRHWRGFAGITPVRLHAEDHPVDPFDAEAAGGDTFDLASLPEAGAAGEIRRGGFRFVRLGAASDRENPDTGEPFVADPVSDGPDVDGIYARWLTVDR